MSSFKHLRWSVDEAGVATVMLDRPPANAVVQAMYDEIARLFSDPDLMQEGVRAIVLSGAGRHFCAGNELAEFVDMTPENGPERQWRVREAFFAIQDCPVPVIAAVHGVALGTGLCLAAACDYVVAAEDAKFGLPELTVGVMGGASHLARLVSQPVVRRMYFTGDHIAAREFQAAGAAILVVPRDEMLAEAQRYARRAASFSPTAVRLAKQILNRIEVMDLKEGYAFEQRFTARMSGHPDSKEAVAAVREKRPPRYRERAKTWTIEV
jgi:enoyl-CoA hydratase